MALDRSFGLHAICVRVGAGHKERGHKNGVSFRIHGLYAEFSATAQVLQNFAK
jgi:hypothetical protein